MGISEDKKNFIKAIGFVPKENTVGIYEKKYSNISNYIIDVDINNEIINYGKLIKADSKTTQNFSQEENFVVLECVNRLLEKGYNPQNIILEKIWPSGHGTSGRLDICVTKDDGTEYLLIECKTYGKEFDKELNNLNKNGGQLFTYFKFSNKADLIMLYTSKLNKGEIIYKNEIVKIEDDYKSGDVKDFYDKWNKLTKDNGVFESWVKPYCFESKALTIKELEEIKPEDSSFIFNNFLEILRHNVVSDKPNAFNKIFTLFLCKIYDEKNNEDTDNELSFQWREGVDNDISFQLRLTDLYKEGMWEFLEKKVTDFSEKDFENKYKNLDSNIKEELRKEFWKIRLEKNNEFAIKEVYDEKSFNENAKVVKQVVELLQKYKIRYAKKQQYLSDFFELLLTTGLKQESGQYFTPVPIAQFILKSLPLANIVKTKLSQSKKDEFLPYIIDYAAGSGHFITESMNEIQKLLNNLDISQYRGETKKFIETSKIAKFDWALRYIYGIEKDYRLVKVGKVGCYLHGDGLANVIHSDGLANFNNSEYKGKLKIKDVDFPKENRQFDIVVSNPPYSVSSFKNVSREYYKEEDFDLYKNLTDNSSEIECLFVERTKQLLKDGGVAGIILPSSILSNTGIYTKTRELILQYFDIVALTELGSNTFMATGTNTVILFLRRRNNYECINLKKSVDKFFTNFSDVTLNGVEKPVSIYVNYVWESLSYDDYVTLLKQKPNDKVQNHDLFKEYSQKIKSKSEKEFWNKIIELEKEKIYYFILAYNQKPVIVKTGEKEAEKQFLGYEFSNRRGSEGIHAIQKSKTIEECTKLFDINAFDNPQKASTYIYKAFNNASVFEIDETLKDNISKIKLIDLMTFDRVDFEKVINTKAKKKLKIESKWNIKELGNIQSLIFEKGKSITKQQTKEGSIPVVAGGLDFAYYHNVSNRNANVITISASGANSGYVNFWNKSIWASDCSTITSNNETIIKIKYVYEILKCYQNDLYSLQKGNAQPHVYIEDLKKIKFPFPPPEIQQKIVDEIEEVEEYEKEISNKIIKNNERINLLLGNLYKETKSTIKLSNTDVFELSIGKRLLNSEVTQQGKIPVYSANVFEPFGYVDKLLIKDFSIPSVLWGIDGDWMVNYIPANNQFYPTDHCGIVRIKQENLIKERYLTYALEQEGKNIGFSRTKRASIDRVSGIKIPLPKYTEQQKIVFQIEELEKQIEEAQKVIDNSKQQKQVILDKYLK